MQSILSLNQFIATTNVLIFLVSNLLNYPPNGYTICLLLYQIPNNDKQCVK